MRIIKCPKCKSPELVFQEQAITLLDHHQDKDGKLHDGVQAPGNIVKTTATCECCGHVWTIKGGSAGLSSVYSDYFERIIKGD